METTKRSKSSSVSTGTLVLQIIPLALLMVAATGCTSIVSPIDAVPAEMVPQEFLGAPRANWQDIDLALLRQQKPDAYLLDSEDVLGVFIETILGGENEQPPVQLQQGNDDLPPSIGYPVPIRDDGTVSLPNVKPIALRGLTLAQAEQKIKDTYSDQIKEDNARVLVTLMKKRTYRVIVVRQDNGNGGGGGGRGQGGVNGRTDFSSRGYVIDLPAYENDVLHALAQTGGLPGVNAKNEVKIARGDNMGGYAQSYQMSQTYCNECNTMGPCGHMSSQFAEDGNFIRIPLRYPPYQTPMINPADVILRDGDIVYVDSRESEVYYTGGLLGGGQFQIPRDFDLDVIAAMSLAGNGLGAAGGGNRGGIGGLGGGVSGIPPGDLIVLRQLPGSRQIAICVDVNEAINDPRRRLLVQPGDTLILRYSPREEFLNFALGTFFTYGIGQLLRNN